MRYVVCLLLLLVPRLSADSALELHIRGEQATTLEERREALSEALTLYLKEQERSPELNYNLGNVYFLLGDYARAIVHYKRAQAALPRDSQVQHNLQTAQTRAGVPVTVPSWKQSLFYFHFNLSLSEKYQLLVGLSVLLFLFGSYAIWSRRPLPAYFTFASAALMCVVWLDVVASTTLAPIRAVAVEASPLYQDAGEHYAPVNGLSVLPGTTLEILESDGQGAWLRVEHPEGGQGYVRHDQVIVL